MFKKFLNAGDPKNLSLVFTAIVSLLLIINFILFISIDLHVFIWIIILLIEIICIYFYLKNKCKIYL